MSWIAYPAWKGGVVSGTCRTEGLGFEGQVNDSDVFEATDTAKFKGGGFLTTPRVFVAFNLLSVSRGNQMNLEVTIRSVTKSDLTWCIRGWDTKIDIAEASYVYCHLLVTFYAGRVPRAKIILCRFYILCKDLMYN